MSGSRAASAMVTVRRSANGCFGATARQNGSRASSSNVVAAFIGYGRLRPWLDEQAARLPGRIVVVDAIAPAELPDYTVDADVGFVGQPPRTLNQRLNLANKLFEYLQAAVPVIVEIVGHISKRGT